ncbi:MAG: phosphoribosylanthranilate isomerase [Candidatus Omnitrophica bacterium]|nr:phosphoribosylanthranilate isomerase [Candidatus Omnitrophota bacterium]
MNTRVKICGIKDKEDASLCVEAGASALGFIFYPKSPRYILPREAEKIVRGLPCFVSKVGVFVNENEDSVFRIANSVGLDTLQFHGAESASYCARFRKNFKVIKSFFPKDADIVSRILKFRLDGVLLDIPFEEKSAKPQATLDFRIIKKIAGQLNFLILSGGLSVVNVRSLVKKLRPYAVDVARGVERFPGKKDGDLVRKFIAQVKEAQGHG